MKSFIIAIGAALALASSSFAACGPDSYVNVSGHCVHRPEHARQAPSGATARCRDGTWSFSEHHQGTCSHHDGVAVWL